MIDYISMRLCCDSKLRPNEEFKLELLPLLTLLKRRYILLGGNFFLTFCLPFIMLLKNGTLMVHGSTCLSQLEE